MKKIIIGLLGSLALLLPSFVLADVSIQLSGNSAVMPGGSSVITGTLTNNSQITTYLNGLISVSVGDPSNKVSVDTVATTGYLPQSLAPGQQFSGPLIKVQASSTAASGIYQGNYVLAGGAATTSLSSLGSQTFTVNVSSSVPAASSTPATTTVPSGLTIPSSTNTGVQLLQMPSGYSGSSDSSSGPGLQMPADQNLPDAQLVMGQYQQGPRLIKLEGSNTVYWVSPNNFKIPMFNNAVFLSYNNKWEDVTTVGQDEFDYYQNAKFIRLNGQGAIYYVQDKLKKKIPSEIWNNSGLDESQIIDVNKTDFNSYKSGSSVQSYDEMYPNL